MIVAGGPYRGQLIVGPIRHDGNGGEGFPRWVKVELIDENDDIAERDVPEKYLGYLP